MLTCETTPKKRLYLADRPITEMAQTLSLQVTKQSPTHITLEGREDALEAFGDRLEQLLRLCGLAPAGK